jgi:hypothetical protein
MLFCENDFHRLVKADRFSFSAELPSITIWSLEVTAK